MQAAAGLPAALALLGTDGGAGYLVHHPAGTADAVCRLQGLTGPWVCGDMHERGVLGVLVLCNGYQSSVPGPAPPFVSCPVLPCPVRQTANTFPDGLVSALQKHPTLLTVHIPALLSGAGASKVRACPWVPWSQCLCALHPHLSMPCVRLRLRPPSG